MYFKKSYLYWKFFRKQTDKMGKKWIVLEAIQPILATQALSNIITWLTRFSLLFIDLYLT